MRASLLAIVPAPDCCTNVGAPDPDASVYHPPTHPPVCHRLLPQNEAPSILGNASCWALHMGLSANLRYQVLNGLDMVGARSACFASDNVACRVA